MRHCEFKYLNEREIVVISDLSINGETWIKPSHVSSGGICGFARIRTETELFPGDVIQLGSQIQFEVHRFNFASASAQGVRPSMEDEDYCTDSLHEGSKCFSMFSVYDGHGGFECSQYLRNNFHSIFASFVADATDVESALSSTFRSADSQFFQLFKEKGLSQNVGAVVNTVVIDDLAIYCANLGDCRAILGLSNGTVLNLSRDLKPGLREESERIHRLGAKVIGNRINGRLAVSRAIGDFEYKSSIGSETVVSSEPEIKKRPLDGSEEFLVLACDGLFDVMSSESVGNFVRNRISLDPNTICVDLIAESVSKRGTTDNVTVIVVLFR